MVFRRSAGTHRINKRLKIDKLSSPNCLTDGTIYATEARLCDYRGRGYAEPFAADPRELHVIGCAFDSEARLLAYWQERSGMAVPCRPVSFLKTSRRVNCLKHTTTYARLKTYVLMPHHAAKDHLSIQLVSNTPDATPWQREAAS